MAFSLRNFVKGAVADVNPFDHGASQATVNRPAPASTAPPPQQQRSFQPAPQQSLISRGFHDITHNPITNFAGRDIVQPVFHAPQAIDNFANKSAVGRGAQAVGLGALRSAVGTGQAVSGLADLLSPGTGTNRFSKSLNNIAKSTDQTAKAEHSNPLLYHGAQAGTDLLQFATGGGELKALGQAPKLAKVTDTVAKAAPLVDSAITAKTAGLAEKGFAGRVAAKTIQNAAKPGYQAANAGFTALQVGKNASQGNKTTPLGVTTQLVAGGVGFPAAGALTHEALGPVANKAVGALRDAHLVAPSKLNTQEVANLAKFRSQAGTGALMDDQTYQAGVAAANKAGIDYRNPQAVDNLLGAHKTFSVRSQQRRDRFSPTPLNAVGGGAVENSPIRKALQNDAKAASPTTKLVQSPQESAAPAIEQPVVAGASSKGSIAPEGSNFTKGEKVGFAGILSPSGEARTGTFVRQVDNHLAEINYGDHTELNHVNNLYKLDQPTQVAKTSAKVEAPPTKQTNAVPQTQKPPALTPPSPTVDQLPIVGTPLKKTGVVDKQLNDLQTVHRQLVDAESQIIKSAEPTTNVAQRVRDAGGISSSDYENLPKGIIRKTGASADKVAQELGYPSEDHLIKALQDEAQAKAGKLTPNQIKEQALQNLQSGKSQHSEDFAHLQQMIKQRQDELSQYPNGKYRQVKVTAKPAKMTEAELQSLSQTPEGMAAKGTNKVLQRNDKKALRNADAERQVQDVLKKGGTTDEALNAYMQATGTDLQTAVKDVKRVAGDSNLGFSGGKNPLLGSVKLPEVQAGDHAQAFLNADFVKQHEQAVGQKALDSFNGLSEKDKTLLKQIETNTVSNVTKKAENPKAFLAAEKQIRTYYDTRHAYDNALGIDVGYRENYLRQLFSKAEEEAKATQPDQVNIKGGNKKPGYTQARSFDTLNTHVGQALERDIGSSSTNHAKLAYSEGLNQAYPGKVNASGQLVRGDNGAYQQITNKYGQGVTADPTIANEINSRSHIETTNKGLQKYDKVNAAVKYTKLGGGAFHALTEAGNFIGQQVSSGKVFTEPQASAKVLKTFFSPKTMDKEVIKFRDNGTLDKAALSGLKIMAKDILADANVNIGGKIAKATGIQALHDATFQREIPYAKLKMFEQGTKNLDVNNPADLTKMRSVAQGVNDLFGGINRDIHGIKPKEFKVLQRFVLATDFTEGKIKTAFNAINITDNSPAAKLARQAVVGKALLFAGLATAGGSLSGEFNGDSPKQVAMKILGKIVDPKFQDGKYTVALPATHVSEFTKPLTPLFRKDGGDKFSGLQKYATNRLAAIPSEAVQIRTNKDGSGARIYGKDYKDNGGQPITPSQTARNVASGFLPIPIAQANQASQGKLPFAAAVANTIGLRTYDTNGTQGKAIDKTSPVAKFDAQKAQAQTNLKNSLSAEDYKLSNLNKGDRQKLIDSGAYTQAKFDGLDKYVANQKQKLGLASNTKPDFYKSSDAEYKDLQTKYDNNIKNNGFKDQAAKITAQTTLAKAKAGSTFDKSIRDAYGLSDSQLYNYVTNDPNGNDIAKQVIAYGDKLVSAGVETKNKFRNKKGAITLGSTTVAKSSGSSRTAKKGISSFISSTKATNAANTKNQKALQNLLKGSQFKTAKTRSLNAPKVALKKQNILPTPGLSNIKRKARALA